MNHEFQLLHERALQIARNYLRSESDLIDILQKIYENRAYRHLGYGSLFEYTTRSLGLSENVAYNLITIAKKAGEVPRLREKIRSREITLSNARMLVPVLTPENQETWFQAAATLPKRELERKIAAVNPQATTPERARYVSGERLELRIGISHTLHQAIERARDLVATRLKKPVSIEETLQVLANTFLEREDPLRKATRSLTRATPSMPGPNPRAIPRPLLHAATLRDENRCTYTRPDGTRCPERKWLELHHVTPVSRGGVTTLENLTTFCRAHHRMTHSSH